MKFLWGLARTWVDMLNFLVEAFDPNEEDDPETTTGGWCA